MFTYLAGTHAPLLNDILTYGGFRRSQNISYRPACEHCNACTSIRVRVGEFKWKESTRRVINKNYDLLAEEKPAQATTEQFSIFRQYLDHRHGDGGMADMTMLDFAMMVENTHVPTRLIEYRTRGQLLACALTDTLSDGLSMVYSFYDTEVVDRSLGTYMILDHIKRTQERNLPYLYLGFWVKGSPKMDYKIRFQPQEHLGKDGWKNYSGK